MFLLFTSTAPFPESRCGPKEQGEPEEQEGSIGVEVGFEEKKRHLLLNSVNLNGAHLSPAAPSGSRLRNHYAAIVELVKNAYDADSPNVDITFDAAPDRATYSICIEDRGHGMSRDTVISHDEKPSFLEQCLAALDFIAANNHEFERLRGAGAEKLLLNFGLAKHPIAERPQYLPPELLLAMGRSAIGLVFAAVDLGKG